MKLLMLIIVAGCFSIAANAQENNINNDIFKKKPWEEYKMRRLQRNTLSRIFPAPPLINKITVQNKFSVMITPLTGVFAGDNGKGDEVYVMSTDKMPCLVPNKKIVTNMPVAGVEKTDNGLLPLLKKDK